MKKIFKTMFVLMCGFVMASSFVACGSDDDNSNSNEQQSGGGEETTVVDKNVAKVTVAYKYVTTEDLLKIFDMKMEFVDPLTGKAQAEMITSTSWSKSYQPKLPFVTGMRLTTTLKEGVTLESIRNTPEYTVLDPILEYEVIAYNVKGQILFEGNSGGGGEPVKATGEKVALGYEKNVFNKSFYNTYTANSDWGIFEEKGKWQ